jgi:biopolymer transport protein ExbD
MRSKKLYLRQKAPAIAADKPFAELNITPLIDVLLVLLVMLMLSIPAVTHKVPVDLPSGTAGTDTPVVNKLFLNAAGTAVWNDIPMDSDRLRARLEMMAKIEFEDGKLACEKSSFWRSWRLASPILRPLPHSHCRTKPSIQRKSFPILMLKQPMRRLKPSPPIIWLPSIPRVKIS